MFEKHKCPTGAHSKGLHKCNANWWFNKLNTKCLVWWQAEELSSEGVKRYEADIFSKTSSLTCTFDHVTSKSIGVIYFLGASTVPSLATFKQRGQEILSGHHLVYRQTDLKVQNIMPLFSKGGIKRSSPEAKFEIKTISVTTELINLPNTV